jgi:hypothetical protein
MTAEIMWMGDPPAVVKQSKGTNKDGVCLDRQPPRARRP